MIMDKSAKKPNLVQKSEEELKEMLEKQETLLLNKKLINSLPDQGKKIEELIENIRKALNAKNSVDDAATVLSRMRIGVSEKSDTIDDEILSSLKPIINCPTSGKIIKDERKNYSNSYEFIMKQNSETAIKSCPEKFVPHRMLKDRTKKTDLLENTTSADENIMSIDNHSSSVPNDREIMQRDKKSSTGTGSHQLKHRYDASLEETFPYQRKFTQGVQMVALEESIDLLNKHQTALKEAELKRAEALLAAKSNVKLSSDECQWQSEKFNRYRDEGFGGGDKDEDEDHDEDSADCESNSEDDS